MLIRVLGGFLMALADSVPGVSGGTVAFLIGIYDEFINSLNNFLSRDKEKRTAAWMFLIKMGAGWIAGMILAALVINQVFETHIYKISSLFIGFILFAVPIMIMEEKDSIVGKYGNVIFTLLGAGLVAVITYFSQNGILQGGVDLAWGNVNIMLVVYTFFAAMCAISAMVLPGISGSTLLLVFGLYQPVMSAVYGIISMNFAYVPVMIVFGLGIVTGILTIVKVLRFGLIKHRSAMMYFIIGMMIGSFYAIIMGPASLKENPQPPMTPETFNVWFFLIGGVVIFGLQALKKIFAKQQ